MNTAYLDGERTRLKRFRDKIREALGVTWDIRDEALIEECRRLKQRDQEAWNQKVQQEKLAKAAYEPRNTR